MATVRRAEERDIPQLMELLLQVDMVHHNGRPDIFKGPATKYTDQELLEIFENDSRPVFVYTDEKDGKVLGYAFCILKEVKDNQLLEDCKTLYVDDLCVDETRRGNGVGKALMAHAVQFAKDCGCHNVTLNVWSFNEKAMRFYASFGMHEQRRTMELLI